MNIFCELDRYMISLYAVKLVKHSDKWFIENKTKKARDLFEALNVALGTEFDPKSAFSCT